VAVYYNENAPHAVAALKQLMLEGVIAPGVIDDRAIEEVQPDDLRGFTQAHFFAGVGAWSVAARHAGWDDERPLWTGSCPCQPFSVAGQGRGTDDPRHLWPHLFRLVRAVRPPVLVGEQVAGRAGFGWFDGVSADLEFEDYACRAVDIPACSVNSPQRRNRLYWVAVADTEHDGRYDASFGQSLSQGKDQGRMLESQGFPTESRPLGILDGRITACDRHSVCAYPDECDDPNECCDRARREARTEDEWADIEDGLVEHPSRLGRGEGWPESELRSRWAAAASSNGASLLLDHADAERRLQQTRPVGEVGGRGSNANAWSDVGDSKAAILREPRKIGRRKSPPGGSGFWRDAEWIQCHDGKARRIPESSFRGLAHGVSGTDDPIDLAGGYSLLVPPFKGRSEMWKLAGNAIVVPLAAEVLRALKETLDEGVT
jgi:DNA (cytosine-5)-methyltransferase 1